MYLENDELTEKIIASCYKVYNTLGTGFVESVYAKALLHELLKSKLHAIPEMRIEVAYDTISAGTFYADIVVENSVILELKALESLNKVHEIQLVNYLKATGINIGLLINFGPNGVEIKRKYKDFIAR